MNDQSTMKDERKLLAVFETMQDAVRAKDIDTIISLYSQDIRAFDAVSQLQFNGVKSYRKHWEECMANCQGESFFDIHELQIEPVSELAYSHFLIHCGGTNEEGVKQSAWMRGTVCCRKFNGEWQITHEHYSVPFDLKTGTTLFDLKP